MKTKFYQRISISDKTIRTRSTTTTIEFSLPANAKVELTIFNTLGQKVQTLVSKNFEAGTHNAVWNGTDFSGKQVSSGIYFYQLKAENFSETKKMVLLK